MIITSSRPLTIGTVYGPGIGIEDLYAITNCDGVGTSEFRFQVLKEASCDEYLQYWIEQGAKRQHLITERFFYLVSMD